jgi:hypothetical protein
MSTSYKAKKHIPFEITLHCFRALAIELLGLKFGLPNEACHKEEREPLRSKPSKSHMNHIN